MWYCGKKLVVHPREPFNYHKVDCGSEYRHVSQQPLWKQTDFLYQIDFRVYLEAELLQVVILMNTILSEGQRRSCSPHQSGPKASTNLLLPPPKKQGFIHLDPIDDT